MAPGTTYDRVLALLAEHPGANLNAVDEQGLFVPLCPELQALGQPSLIARSGVENVDPRDHGTLLEAWSAALAGGEGCVDVRERTAPDGLTRLHLLDLRASLGVLVAIGYPLASAASEEPASPRSDRPRVGRVRKDLTSTLVGVDPDAAALLGYAPEALLGVRTLDLVHPDDHDRAVSSWLEVVADPATVRCTRLRHRRADGSWLWLDVTNHNRFADPAEGCMVSDLVDASSEVAAREDARAGERLLRRLAQALPVGLLQLSLQGEVTYANDRLADVLGVRPGGRLEDQLGLLHAHDRRRLLAATRRSLQLRCDEGLQVRLDLPGGARLSEVTLRVLRDGERVEGLLACVTDVTESVQLRAELERRATFDDLTGCLNRRSLLQRLETDLARCWPLQGCAVLFLDLDGFKAVNDTHGHAAGDAALRGVAEALRLAVRGGDAVGRFGGDEFVVVCPGVPSAEQALALAVGLEARVRAAAPGLLRRSTGVAWTDDPAEPADELVGRADAAMYLAKTSRSGVPVLCQAVGPLPALVPGSAA